MKKKRRKEKYPLWRFLFFLSTVVSPQGPTGPKSPPFSSQWLANRVRVWSWVSTKGIRYKSPPKLRIKTRGHLGSVSLARRAIGYLFCKKKLPWQVICSCAPLYDNNCYSETHTGLPCSSTPTFKDVSLRSKIRDHSSPTFLNLPPPPTILF